MALFSPILTTSDLVMRFGPMPLNRFGPGALEQSGTEDAVIQWNEQGNRLFELVDGILVEKAMGAFESFLTSELIYILSGFVKRGKLGIVLPPDGMMRLWPGRVRIPDISFISWDRLPGRRVPRTPMFELSPNLAIEVISPSNTRQEMQTKLDDYFTSGVELCWYIYPEEKQVRVFTSPGTYQILHAHDSLDGGAVLPGLIISLEDFFSGDSKSSK